MPDFIFARYSRKPESLYEIESTIRYEEGTIYKTQIIETKAMTSAEYDAFVARPLASRDWLAGKGGWRNNIRMAIAVTAPDRHTLYVDPSGSDYGRYIGMEVMSVKYPSVRVQLTGHNGNAFNILGLCRRAAQKGEVSAEEIRTFIDEATSDDYNHLLATCQKWFNCY